MNQIENPTVVDGQMPNELIEYYINPTKRTVVAVVTVPKDTVVDEMMHIFAKASGSSFIATNFDIQKNLLVKGTYVGKAVCHENDEFDRETGMQIAKLRALRSLCKDKSTVINRMERIFSDAASRMNLAVAHNDISLEHINEALENI